ncbi:universal stress protein [Actinomycetospora sp. TBRC 11914]|uniref:universal stress protein n=1 Tax=Actinomycetospora sp. TBRC 11914 TaxID=2729387 RepID=UPI00145E9D3C|nr:universal stress protein [Actinomycetospora sp. TBRC 11914]NMO89447.1 universal stress protein [Actinomycetospora sp. TBRC 11914]
MFAPTDRSRRRVLRWATRHAARTGGSLQVLVDPADPPPEPGPATTLVQLLARTAGDVVSRVLSPLRRSSACALARELAAAVAGARLLVVPQSLPQLPALVDMLTEPLVAVPDRPLPRPDACVVLALAPWTGPEVIGSAFETAARYGVDLRAVRAVEGLGDADAAERSCEDDLAVWRITRPEVGVDVEVVDREPLDALVHGSRDAQLVVAGRPARGRARDLLAPSPTADLLRLSACPVLVVPPPGPPRHAWSARPGWGSPH